LLWTGRPIYGIWVSFPKTRPIQTTAYGTIASDPAQAVFCSKGAALVVLNDFSSQFQNLKGRLPGDDPENLFGSLKLYGKYSDGNIYLCP
jgi:hypothetical protein